MAQYLTPQEISARAAYFQKRKAGLEDDLKGLRQQIGAISAAKIQKDRVLKDLNTAEEELQQDEIEKTKWRVEVIDADRPLGAFRDTRISLAGAAGGLGGVFAGFGLVLLLGLIDRRVRNPGDAAGQFTSAPILGMLPQLPDDLADPEQGGTSGPQRARNSDAAPDPWAAARTIRCLASPARFRPVARPA